MSLKNLLAAAALPLALLACDGTSKAAEPAGKTAAPAPAAAKAVPAGPYQSVLAPYEKARAALAGDSVGALAQTGADLEAAAMQLSATAPVEQRPHLAALATAASKLKTQTEIEAARLAFGEASKPVVLLLAADAAAQKPYFVMECPMVKGYQKWVQLDDRINNPYMGAKMLECGSKSSWN